MSVAWYSILALVLAGCSASTRAEVTPCHPGQTKPCVDQSGCSGTAVCGADRRYSACSCPTDGGGAGGATGTGGVAGAGGVSGSGGNDAGLDGSSAGSAGDSGSDASPDSGSDASPDGAAGDGGGACPNGPSGGDGTVSYPLWPVPTENLRATAEFTTTNDTVLDHATCLMWQRGVNAGAYSWDAAKSVCDNLTLAGYSDWRLPTRAELISITDFTSYAPALDASVFLDTPTGAGPSSTFWASTVLARDATQHWASVLGGAGGVVRLPSTESHSVRCVRGTGAPTTARFDSSTPAVVFDLETGLEWEASPANQDVTEAQAESYCQGLVLDNHSDWRLPSVRELSTLIDPTDATRALPTSFSLVGYYFWSSTLTPGKDYWVVSMGDGYTAMNTSVVTSHRVRCVRRP